MHTLVFPILLYGAETWTIKNRKKKRISAFEMWAWRRLLRIFWVHYRTNDSILQEIYVKDLFKRSTECNLPILVIFLDVVQKA